MEWTLNFEVKCGVKIFGNIGEEEDQYLQRRNGEVFHEHIEGHHDRSVRVLDVSEHFHLQKQFGHDSRDIFMV